MVYEKNIELHFVKILLPKPIWTIKKEYYRKRWHNWATENQVKKSLCHVRKFQ